MSTDQRKTVVVVGGGAAGATIAKDLAGSLDFSKHNLILVNDRPFYLHRIAALRAHVTPQGNFDERMQIPYDGVFPNGNGKLVVGTVTSIVESDNGGHVELDNGEKIAYSALVLATGSNWGGPADIPVAKSDISQSVNSWRSKVEKASNIVVVGGGAIGIELAGEIKESYPPKKVTIVHGQEHLLNDTYPAKYRTKVDRLVRSKGIELVLNDVVPEKYFNEDPSSVTSITTKTGRTIGTDFLIPARGPKPNTGFIAASLGEGVLDAAGQVKVEPTLQLSSHPRIFAAGDITNIREQKQAMKAGGHGGTIVPNVVALLNGQVPSKKYKGAYEIIALTVGLDGASYMGLLWGIILGGWVTGILKSKDLVVNMTRGRLGVKN